MYVDKIKSSIKWLETYWETTLLLQFSAKALTNTNEKRKKLIDFFFFLITLFGHMVSTREVLHFHWNQMLPRAISFYSCSQIIRSVLCTVTIVAKSETPAPTVLSLSLPGRHRDILNIVLLWFLPHLYIQWFFLCFLYEWQLCLKSSTFIPIWCF